MNTIKGLILKDILELKNYKKTLIMFFIITILFSFTGKNLQESGTSMLIVMSTLGFGMFSIASFSYDEVSKTDKFILTAPITKKEIVLSKYIFVIISTILGCIIGILISLIGLVILNKQPLNIVELIQIAFGGLFVIGIMESIQIPLIYKYGMEKGRIYLFIATLLFAFGLGSIFYLAENLMENAEIGNILNTIIKFITLIFIAITCISYYISYKTSLKIYSKKEL